MLVIEKIKINDVKEFAGNIFQHLPDFQPEFESYGAWTGVKDFDIDIDHDNQRITVIGIMRGHATAVLKSPMTYDYPEEGEITSNETEIAEISFWTEDGEEIEIENKIEIMNEIDKLLK